MRDKAIVFTTGEGKLLSARGSAMFFKPTHASTNGAFSFMERTLPPGGRKPPPHIHADCEEAFYVLEGEIEFCLGADTVLGRPGSFVHVPGGVSHTFGNAARHRRVCSSFTRRRWIRTLKSCRSFGPGMFLRAQTMRAC